MMQPFFIRTRATMMSLPTTNCRCSSGFKSSRPIEDQGTYFTSILLAGLCFTAGRFAVLRFAVLRLDVLPLAVFVVWGFLAEGFAFAISVHPPFVDSDRI